MQLRREPRTGPVTRVMQETRYFLRRSYNWLRNIELFRAATKSSVTAFLLFLCLSSLRTWLASDARALPHSSHATTRHWRNYREFWGAFFLKFGGYVFFVFYREIGVIWRFFLDRFESIDLLRNYEIFNLSDFTNWINCFFYVLSKSWGGREGLMIVCDWVVI